jgi:oxygen-independent coproporphyrinogen-3 oxidase
MMTRSFKKTEYTFTDVPKAHFEQSFGIYVHVPFCYTKCSFCPFYKELYSEQLKEKFTLVKQRITLQI